MTRYMQIFGHLENSILMAQANANKQQLASLLSPFFELNSNHHTHILRDVIINQKPDGIEWQISKLRVYEVGVNAVAYFTLTAKGQAARTIVDVWEPKQKNWQLCVRFEAH